MEARPPSLSHCNSKKDSNPESSPSGRKTPLEVISSDLCSPPAPQLKQPRSLTEIIASKSFDYEKAEPDGGEEEFDLKDMKALSSLKATDGKTADEKTADISSQQPTVTEPTTTHTLKNPQTESLLEAWRRSLTAKLGFHGTGRSPVMSQSNR